VTLKPDGTDTVLASDFATGVKRRAEAFAGGSVSAEAAGGGRRIAAITVATA